MVKKGKLAGLKVFIPLPLNLKCWAGLDLAYCRDYQNIMYLRLYIHFKLVVDHYQKNVQDIMLFGVSSKTVTMTFCHAAHE